MTETFIWGILIVSCVLLAAWLIYGRTREYLSSLDPMLHRLRREIALVDPTINQVSLYEGSSSYTINKKKMYLCLKDENGEYYDYNMLLYVTLHELAHVINKEDIGHTAAFYDRFDELLQKAEDVGLYDPNQKVISNYCQYEKDGPKQSPHPNRSTKKTNYP